MRITPIDIAHKSFQRKMMGLDPDQVTDFLRFVADEMESVIRERNALKEALREKELSVSEYRERDELLKSTITTATRMSEKMQADAEREGKLILQDANQKAEMIVRDARDSLKRIYQDISDLKRIRLQFENNLKALIQSHLAMMDQGQRIMPNPSLDPRMSIEEEASSAMSGMSASSHSEMEKRISDAITSKTKGAGANF